MDEDSKLNPRLVVRDCPGCGKRIVFSASGESSSNPIMVTCPNCHSDFVFLNDEIYPYASSVPVSPSEKEESPQPEIKQISPQQKKKRIIGLSIALGIAALIGIGILLWVNRHVHTWADATCDKPITCTGCGKTKGSPNGHSWQSATCTAPITCSICGATKGSPIEHTWMLASCEKPKYCIVCGTKEGSPNGHSWSAATCTKAKTCSVCGKVEGKAPGHNWSKETLTTPSICSRCGEKQPMKTPKSGQVYTGSDLDCPSELTIIASSKSVYVKLKNAKGKTVFSFFARAYKTTTVSVPAGKYRVYFAHGTDWYGPKYYFGDSTTYSKDNELRDFSRYTYTYTLYSVTDGNFQETPVNKSEFD